MKKAKKRSITSLYYELLFAVARKFEGESRHETALRYIREAESMACSGEACSSSLALPVYERDPRSQCIVNRRGDPPESCASSGSPG